MTTSLDMIPVRRGEEIDLERLRGFLRNSLEDFPDGPIEILQFSAGHSNLTYQIRVGDWEAVLRRPPLGPVAPKAHDMEREFKIISEIHPLFPPAPKPILLSNDESIVGAPFFLMERKHGTVLDSTFPEAIEVTPELCRNLSEVMVDNLVNLHSIDYTQTELTAISKPDGFLERQVHGWISRYNRAKTDDLQEAEEVMKWLSENIPSQKYATIIHYDYKFNNAMFSKDLKKMVGLFDWEMTTVGDPLADLGVALSYWNQPDDPELLRSGLGSSSLTVIEGFMSRKEFIELYGEKSGRNIADMNFYMTFAYFKLAVIVQQIYYRFKKGQTRDARFSKFNDYVKSLMTHSSHTVEM